MFYGCLFMGLFVLCLDLIDCFCLLCFAYLLVWVFPLLGCACYLDIVVYLFSCVFYLVVWFYVCFGWLLVCLVGYFSIQYLFMFDYVLLLVLCLRVLFWVWLIVVLWCWLLGFNVYFCCYYRWFWVTMLLLVIFIIALVLWRLAVIILFVCALLFAYSCRLFWVRWLLDFVYNSVAFI